MKRFQRILVILSGRAGDRAALEWARRVAGAAGSEHVECLLVDPDPADWVPEYPEPEEGVRGEERLHQAAVLVGEVLGERGGLQVPTAAGVGAPLPTVLHRLLDGGFDLVIVGEEDEADRLLAEKLARKSPASVLSVPAGAPDRCERILTATDFSSTSILALDVAAAFASAMGAEDLVCLHSFRIPSNPAKLNHSPEQVRQWYRQAAGVHLAGFLENSPQPAAGFRAVLREAPIPGAGIVEELNSNPYDLVVLTTRGRNAVSRALLGSNTAEVIRRSPVPVLAVKVKGEGLSLLRSLLGIGERGEPRMENPS